MSLYKYLIILGICTLVCWSAFISVLFLINPFEAGFLGFVFFYVSLAFALIGTFSILGFVFRTYIKKDDMAVKHINIASRQSFLFTLMVLLALVLQSLKYLVWWNLILLVLVLAFVELFFMSYKKYNR